MDSIRLVPAAFSEKSGYENFYISSGQPAGVNGKNNWDYGNKSSSLLKPDQVKCIYPWLKFNGVIKVKTDTIENFVRKTMLRVLIFYIWTTGRRTVSAKGGGENIRQYKKLYGFNGKMSPYMWSTFLKPEVVSFLQRFNFYKIKDTVGA